MTLSLSDPSLRTVLFAGANRGIGLEIVRQLLEKSDCRNVIAMARQPQKATELIVLQEKYPNLSMEPLDVSILLRE